MADREKGRVGGCRNATSADPPGDRSRARCTRVDQLPAMRASLVIPVARVLTWGCVILLAVLSLWPGRGIGFLYVLPEFNSMRTGLPGRLEHFIAYAGSAAVAMAGLELTRFGGRFVT